MFEIKVKVDRSVLEELKDCCKDEVGCTGCRLRHECIVTKSYINRSEYGSCGYPEKWDIDDIAKVFDCGEDVLRDKDVSDLTESDLEFISSRCYKTGTICDNCEYTRLCDGITHEKKYMKDCTGTPGCWSLSVIRVIINNIKKANEENNIPDLKESDIEYPEERILKMIKDCESCSSCVLCEPDVLKKCKVVEEKGLNISRMPCLWDKDIKNVYLKLNDLEEKG